MKPPTATKTVLPPAPRGLAEDFTAGACRCNGSTHTYGDNSCSAYDRGEK
jgi:hypothetical protein